MNSTRKTDQTPSSERLIGQLFGPFRLVRLLGRGGMSTVYEAVHSVIGKRVAVKVLSDELACDINFKRCLREEAIAVNLVEHPSLVEIYEFGQREDGLLFIVMEYLRGETLGTWVARQPAPWPIPRVVRIGLSIARSLSVAHARGVIHRDLKPDNLMLIPEEDMPGGERVKILDFGIAKLGLRSAGDADSAATSTWIGTPEYMAPEQYGGADRVDGQADVFSLGATLYELVTGRSPFGLGNSFRVLIEPPKPVADMRVGLQPELSALIDHMLAKDPLARPSMQQVATALSACKCVPDISRLHWAAGAILVLLAGIAAGHLPKSWVMERMTSALPATEASCAVAARLARPR